MVISEALSPPANLWSDVGFNNLHFKRYNIPFNKEFPADNQTLCSKLTSSIISMKDNILLGALML